MLLASKCIIYAYDPVVNSTMQVVIDGLSEVQAIAVDTAIHKLYVADYDSQAKSGYVFEYQYSANLTIPSQPVLSVNFTSAKTIYTGGKVVSIKVDRDIHKLFIADQTKGVILSQDISDPNS